MNIIKATEQFFTVNTIGSESTILVAFSGGPDSTALLNLLSDSLGRSVAIAYFDHGLRDSPVIAREVDNARKWADYIGCAVHIDRPASGELERIAARVGTEAAARICRYRFLESIAEKNGYDYIAVGHTSDDHIETIIQNVFRGGGAAGISGISAVTGRVIRPLINVSKAEVLRYLNDNGISFETDTTNSDKRFLRNAVRNELIPRIETIFTGYRRSLGYLSEKMEMIEAYISERANEEIPMATSEDRSTAYMNLSDFENGDPVVRLAALYSAYDSIYSDRELAEGRGLPYRHVRQLIRRSNIPSNHVLLTGAGIRVYSRVSTIEISRDIVSAGEKGYLIIVRDAEPTVYDNRAAGFTTYVSENSSDPDTACEFGIGTATFPLLVRSRDPGDWIETGNGHRTIKRLFQRWEVPKTERSTIPVVEDTTGIQAVIGSFAGYRDWIADDAPLHETPGSAEPVLGFRSIME